MTRQPVPAREFERGLDVETRDVRDRHSQALVRSGRVAGGEHSEAGGEGSKAVLEVRSHKVPFILQDGQIIGQLIFERLTETPDEIYGAGIGSHYQAQGLKLSKHFK